MSWKRLIQKGIALVIVAALSQGCSNNFVTATSPTFATGDNSPAYFPLDEGFSSTYQITASNGLTSMISYSVAKEIDFQGGKAIPWVSSQNGQKDTSYFVLSGNSLVFYNKKKSEPEVILELPLKVGNSWDRYDTPESGDNGDGENGGLKDSTNGGASLAASFLIDGSPLMTVDRVESIELSNGRYYSGVYRVSNYAGGNSSNYFWYAPGVGMIKYVLGSVNSDNPSGSINAELIYYGSSF